MRKIINGSLFIRQNPEQDGRARKFLPIEFEREESS